MRATMLAVLAAALFLAGCGRKTPPLESHSSTGVIEAVRGEGKEVVIAHQAFPDGFMEAMTMPFAVSNTALVQGFKAGDRVDFTLTRQDDDWYLSSLSKHR